MSLNIFATQCQDDTLVVVAQENVSSLASRNVRNEAEALMAEWAQHRLKHIVIDLEKAEYFGTYMLELIHALWRRLRPTHGKMALYHVSDIGREVLRIARLDMLWPVCATREDALRAVQSQPLPDG